MAIKKYLPSRNMSIFLVTVSTLISSKLYDKQQCNKLFEEFHERVKRLRLQPISSEVKLEKFVVLLASPENDYIAHYKAKLYFETYIKPIFDSAAYDYQLIVESENLNIQTKLHQQLLDPTLNGKINEEGFQTAKVAALLPLGREAYLKTLLGLADCCNLPYTQPSEVQVESDSSETKGKDKEMEVKLSYERKELDSSIQPNNLSTIPPIYYLPFHHYYGWRSLPIRIFNWFNIREKVSEVGNLTVEMLTAANRPLNLNQDIDTFISKDKRSDTIEKADLDTIKSLIGGLDTKLELKTSTEC